jgi:hypothetical protein
MCRLRIRLGSACLGWLLILLTGAPARADIFRWDNGQLIPGTQGITLGPGVQLPFWNTDLHNLRYADFTGDLSDSIFYGTWLDSARFINVNLTSANFGVPRSRTRI